MKGLEEGKQVHAHIIQSGFKPNIFLLNTLVNMYTKCGSMVDARRVFDNMPRRDMFSWNMLIAGYAKHGCGWEALEIYKQMQWEGLRPNKVTFICVLDACSRLAVLKKGREAHADIIRAGIAPDIALQTALANMYAKCGSIKDARYVFDNMAQRNVVSWNMMIAGYSQHGRNREALEMYERMVREGVTPNRITFTCIVNVCATLADLRKAKEAHDEITKAAILPHMLIETALADMYIKCGSVKDARHVFDNMTQRDVVSWSAMIAGYAQHGCGWEALEIYKQMIGEGVTPNQVTFTCVLNACASPAALEIGKKVHADIIKAGIVPHIILETALADMYIKCGSIKNARQVFDNMAKRDVASWNAMITGYSQHGFSGEALEMYEQMIQEGVTPNQVTFTSVLHACGGLGILEKGKTVHADIIKAGTKPHIILDTALVAMYAKCGRLKDARKVFDSIAQRDVVLWSAMIAGYAQHGFGGEALEIYEQMIREGVTPNRVTFTSVLNACGSLAALERGKEVHADIINAGVAPHIILDTALVVMYAKCGSIKDARQVFDNMAEQDVVSWSAMIAGYGQHGFGREAVQLFEQMLQEGLKPNYSTFICLLSACSRMGLVDEGRHYLDSISRDHGLAPTVEHFGCMVDLLGRAGRLDEAEDIINRMPIEPDAWVCETLLGACRIHGDLELAERMAHCLLKLDPQDTVTCMILSDIYGAAGRWDDQERMRK